MKPIHLFKIAAIKYGIYLCLSLMVIFMIMRITELSNSLAFRFVDILAIYIIVGRALHFYQTHTPDGQSYLRNLGLGVTTSFFGMFFFALFIFSYMSFFDPEYLEYLRDTAPMGPHLNPYIISVFLIVEGVAAGALSGFIQALLMRKPLL